MVKDKPRVAVLSGKGGTGKTLTAVNLAAVAEKALYIDCDVEEPNGHLFFKPENIRAEVIFIPIPLVAEKLCKGCRKCVDFCKFNALAYINSKLIIFPEICHSCGGCILLCPENALTERNQGIGQIQRGSSENVTVVTGILNVGEASGIPIIKELLKENAEQGFAFIDCPPGSACIVMETIKDADYCILVAEPTIFGVHNLNMVYELVKLFHKPFGVVLNKCLEGLNPAEEFCREKDIRILGRIPYSDQLGTINSNALIPARIEHTYRDMFAAILSALEEDVEHEAALNP